MREEFRARALACAENAEQASDPAERLQLLEMAEAWINLAERVSQRWHGSQMAPPGSNQPASPAQDGKSRG